MPELVICSKCGGANAAGDQFCGTCGTFLEWSGEPVDRDPSVIAGTPAPEPPRPTTPRDAVPSSPGSPAVECPACQERNPVGRTFCQRCGTRLAGSTAAAGGAGGSGAGRGGGLGADAASSLRGAGGSDGGPGTSIGGTATPAPTSVPRRDGSAAGRTGLPSWLPVVAGLGLVVGIAIVAVALALGALSQPASLAATSPSPSPTFTPTLGPSAGASAVASSSPGPSNLSPEPSVPSAPPTPSAPSGLALTPVKASASSVVGNRAKFQPSQAIDGRLDTSWQEGAAEERGQWIEIAFERSTLEYLVIYSGYQLSRDAYLGNRRPRDIAVTVDGGSPSSFRLADSEQPQRVDIPDVPGATRVRIEIVSTYDPQATAYPGSPFDDLAISEIRLFGVPGAT